MSVRHQEKWHGFDIWYYDEDRPKDTCLRYGYRVRKQHKLAFDVDGRVDVVTQSSVRQRYKDSTLSRVRAIIDLQSFEWGETFERSLDVPRTSDNAQISDDELRPTLLEVFYVIQRELSRSYARERVDIDGLCMELGISKHQYYSAINYLLGKGWLERSVVHEDEYSHVFITVEGIDEYKSFEQAQPAAELHPIVIVYREDDSKPYLGAIDEKLRGYFGPAQVFTAKWSIEAGALWPASIRAAVQSCEVVILLIGPQWLTATDEEGRRRLDKPKDFHRQEIETALGRQAVVIPALVGGATMPGEEDLPSSLKELADLQAHKIRDDDWSQDTDNLIKLIEKYRETRT